MKTNDTRQLGFRHAGPWAGGRRLLPEGTRGAAQGRG